MRKRATATNTPYKAARHFYIWNSLHGANTIKEGSRHDFVRQDVMRNAPPRLNDMIKISGSMNNAVHLNRVAANDVEYQI